MSSTVTYPHANKSPADVREDDFQYRPLSSGAIASAIFGIMGLLTFVAGSNSLQSCLMLCPIPLVGLVVGLKSLSAIRSMPDQLSGLRFAWAGVLLSAIGLFGGGAYATFVHATEVPDGYARTSFYELRPDEVEIRRDIVVPEDIQELNNQKVFIKGYIRPGTTVTKDGTPVRRHVGRFLLVRDNNECCFGDQSKVKYYDQVLVTLADTLTTNDTRGLVRIGGTLRSNPKHLSSGIGMPVYTLEADYLQ